MFDLCDGRHGEPSANARSVWAGRAIVGALAIWGTADSAFSQVSGGHNALPPTKTYYLRCASESSPDPVEIEFPLIRSTPAPSVELNQTLSLPPGWPTMRVVRYLPRAVVEQSVVANDSEDARAALLLTIEGRSQKIDRWLVADDPAHNRLNSYIALWRYMAVPDRASRDELFDQFTHELTRDPQLLIRKLRGDSRHAIPFRAGETYEVDDPACKVTVREFFPHFALDSATKKPINQSLEFVNPAVSLSVEKDGRTVDVWVFSKHPDRGARAAKDLGLDLRLDCAERAPSDEPDIVIVTVGGKDHEAWVRVNGEVTPNVLKLGEDVPIGCTRYAFRAAEFQPKARLVEGYKPDSGPESAPALCVEIEQGSGSKTQAWLKLDKPARLADAQGDRTLTLTFSSQPLAAQGAHP